MRVYHGHEAAKVHQYLHQQEELDNSISIERRRELRKTLRYSLCSSHTVPGVKARAWFDAKMSGMLAYGLTDKSQIPAEVLEATKLYFSEGISYKDIGTVYRVTEHTIRRRINWMLDQIIDTLPIDIVRLLNYSVSKIVPHGCTREYCGGDLLWDNEGAHGDGEGEYCCLMCAQRYTFVLEPVSICPGGA